MNSINNPAIFAETSRAFTIADVDNAVAQQVVTNYVKAALAEFPNNVDLAYQKIATRTKASDLVNYDRELLFKYIAFALVDRTPTEAEITAVRTYINSH